MCCSNFNSKDFLIDRKPFELNMFPCIRFSLVILLVSTFFIGCKKLVEVDNPYTTTNASNVYSSDDNAVAVLTGIYTKMSNSLLSGNNGFSMLTGLSSDEFSLYSGVSDVKLNAYYKNYLIMNSVTSIGSEFWSPIYNHIYVCNAAIEGLEQSNQITPSVKQQLLGEAKFLRAFFFFYMINFFGDVPMPLNTAYQINTILERATTDKVYNQIIADLKDAETLLSSDYLNGKLNKYSSGSASERVRPTKWAANALLARVYLYFGDYSNAENQASLVINKDFYKLTTLNATFLKNSTEAIWQLQPVKSGRNTDDGVAFILTSSGPTANSTRPVFLSNYLLNSFEANDQRKAIGNWLNKITTSSGITYHFPYKYKNNSANITEYLMVLRLGEQYLIRAEAKAQQNNLSSAITDLDSVRKRAGLPLISSIEPGIGQTALLDKIYHERQVELFTEMGQRWFDLKRLKMVDAVMRFVTPQKGSIWQPYQQLYPLPWSDLIKNSKLIQNEGYD